jgi:hypothetical protein
MHTHTHTHTHISWTHAAWTLEPKNDEKFLATFKVYINGTLVGTLDDAFYPVNIPLTSSRIGTSAGGNYYGYIDSFMAFPAVLTDAEVKTVYEVRYIHTYIHTYIYIYIHVYVYIYIYIYI